MMFHFPPSARGAARAAIHRAGRTDQLFRPSRVIVSNDTDQTLLERYRGGDQDAFAELVVRYQRPIYNAAFWVLRRAEDANDVAQEVFLKVAERSDDYDPRYKFFSWIYRIAVNESLNLLRRNGREEALDDDVDLPDPAGSDPERLLGDAQLSARVRSALMRLPVNDRMVLTLRHFSECSYEEIAQILDIDEKTVKSRLFDARRRLRDLLPDLRPR
jgi:RNA polymerase sigma-70 factor, ECF subfamily